MTTQERTWLEKLMDEIEGAVELRPHEIPVLVGMVRRTLNGSHGAASHAPKRGRPRKAAAPASEEGGA